MTRTIPTVDYRLALSRQRGRAASICPRRWRCAQRNRFFRTVAPRHPRELVNETYAQCDAFFDLDESTKRTYLQPDIGHQRGYTAFGIEHAKDNPAPRPQGKGILAKRSALPDDGTVPTYPQNIWPSQHVAGFQATTESLFTQAWNNSPNAFSRRARCTSEKRRIGYRRCPSMETPSCA